MAVCNDSDIAEEDGQWEVTGEPTEGTLRTLARKAGFEVKDYERVAVIPFESGNKFMDTIDRVPQTGDKGLALKERLQAKLIEHKRYINENGEDMPEIRNWKWGASHSV